MALAAKIEDLGMRIDELGKPAWIALVILSFIAFWPLGFAVLGYMIWSGRMGCWGRSGAKWQARAERMRARGESWTGWGKPHSSGNRAFDEYRAETLRRLEEEEREFHEFLDRLRQAKDKAEFDQFMAERRRRSEGPSPEAGAA